MVSSAIWDKSALVNLSYWPGRLVYWHLRRILNRTVGSEDNQEFEKTRFVPAINLANFLKTNIYSEIWSPGLIEKEPKGRFFAPDKLEINNCKGKGKEEKYKEGGGRKEEKKKAMIVLLVFIGYLSHLLTEDWGLFSGNVIKNPARYINNSPWP